MNQNQEKTAGTIDQPKRPFPVLPTSKVLASGRFTSPPTPEQLKTIFPKEVPATLRLYLGRKDRAMVGSPGSKRARLPHECNFSGRGTRDPGGTAIGPSEAHGIRLRRAQSTNPASHAPQRSLSERQRVTSRFPAEIRRAQRSQLLCASLEPERTRIIFNWKCATSPRIFPIPAKRPSLAWPCPMICERALLPAGIPY